TARASRSAGEWNTMRITATGARVGVEVNGTRVLDANLDDYAQQVDAVPGIPLRRGRIGLQSWDGVVEFRNLMVKPAAGVAVGEFVALFNGKDMAGWREPAGQLAMWKVVDGVLTGTAAGNVGNLFTERDDYGDFHLRAEARVSDGGNGGVYFRCANAA